MIALTCFLIVINAFYPNDAQQVVTTEKKANVVYTLIGHYNYLRKGQGNDVARIFLPQQSSVIGGSRTKPLPGMEGSSTVVTNRINSITNYDYNQPWTPPLRKEALCSEYRAELVEKAMVKPTEAPTTTTTERPTTTRSSKKIVSKRPTKATTTKSPSKKSASKGGKNEGKNHDIYFSSKTTYEHVMKILNGTTLSKVDKKIYSNADYYLHHFKMNILVLVSNINDYSKIKECFRDFVQTIHSYRDYMIQYYDSCKAHYEQTCSNNALIYFQDSLHELQYRTHDCVSRRINN
uniref:Putative 30 kDa salivary gland allergen/aegyptin n=1 Tax=Psorophora albipes TaxID=869069 RepID=T1E2U5_9DIPT